MALSGLPACAALLRKVEQRHSLQLEGVEQVAARAGVLQLRPRESAMRQGEPACFVFVVRSGLLKQQYVGEDGTERIKSFTAAGDLFACVDALEGRAASFGSVAIEPSVVERIDFRVVDRLARTSLPWQTALRIAFQQLALRKIGRERDLLLHGPRELYSQLARAHPEWVERIPQKDLAAYLGVTPVGLNRIVQDHRRTGIAD
jgi:CRP-like cAMP-binding protein